MDSAADVSKKQHRGVKNDAQRSNTNHPLCSSPIAICILIFQVSVAMVIQFVIKIIDVIIYFINRQEDKCRSNQHAYAKHLRGKIIHAIITVLLKKYAYTATQIHNFNNLYHLKAYI